MRGIRNINLLNSLSGGGNRQTGPSAFPGTVAWYEANRYNSDYDVLLNQSGTTGLTALGASLYTDRARVYGGIGYLPGVSGNYFSAADSAAASQTGDMSMVIRVNLSTYTPAGRGTFFSKYNDTGNQRSYTMGVETDGTIRCLMSTNGIAVTNFFSTTAIPVSGGTTVWLRADFDADNGAAGRTMTFYYSTDATNNPDSVSWTAIGVPVVAATAAGLFDSTSPLVIGGVNDGTSGMLNGSVYYAAVYSGIFTTKVVTFDFSVVPDYAYGWVGALGNVMTVNVTTAYNQADFYKVGPAQLGSAGFYTNARIWGGLAYIPGTANNFFSAPHVTSYSGDYAEFLLYCSAADWTPSATQIIACKRDGGTGSEGQINLDSGGTLTFAWAVSGAGSGATSTVSTGFFDGSGGWLKITRTRNGGSQQIRFFTSRQAPSTSEANLTLTQLGATVSVAVGNPTATTAPTYVGSFNGANTFNGTISRFIGRSVALGTAIIDFNPALVADLATSWTDAVGNVITVTKSTASDTNDPTRLVYAGSPYVYDTGAINNFISTPDSAVLDISGDIEFSATFKLSSYSSVSTNICILGKWLSSGTNRAYYFGVTTTGLVQFYISTTGADFPVVNSSVSLSTVFSANQLARIKATRVQSTGVVTFFTSLDGTTWNQLGTTQILSAGSAIFVNTTQVTLMAAEGGGGNLMTGELYYTELRNGIGGTVVAKFDASLSAQTGYTDPVNSTVWTINRASSGKKLALVDRNMLLMGTDDYLEVADHQLLDFAAAGNLTAAISYREFGSLASATRIAKKTAADASGAGYVIRQNTATPTTLQGQVSDGASVATGTLTTTPVDGAATLSAVVRTSGTGTTLNSNGSTNTDAANNALAASNSEVLRVGRLSGAGTGYADQEAFGFSVIRRALTALELTALRQQLKGNA